MDRPDGKDSAGALYRIIRDTERAYAEVSFMIAINKIKFSRQWRQQRGGQIKTTNKKQREIFISVKYLRNELVETIYSHQTGKYPVRSSKGNQYIMVMCVIYRGEIMVEKMRNQTAGEMVKSYQVLVYWLKNCGVTPKIQILDNATLEDFKDDTKKNKMTYQLIPPHDHRRNIAENTVQTFKNNLLSILCGMDKNLPMQLWDRLLWQLKLTLNLLRQSIFVLTISAYVQLYGPHDQNTEPLAPLWFEVDMNIKPTHIETFVLHLMTGFYTGTYQ